MLCSSQQAGGAQLEEGSGSGHEATGRVEGPVASVQVPPETAGGGVPSPGPSATQALGLLGLPVQLLQVRTGLVFERRPPAPGLTVVSPQVVLPLLILHGLGLVPLTQPLLVLQLLLQPLLPAQLLQRQPLQVALHHLPSWSLCIGGGRNSASVLVGRSRSFSTSPSPSPATLRNTKPKADVPPLIPKGLVCAGGVRPSAPSTLLLASDCLNLSPLQR